MELADVNTRHEERWAKAKADLGVESALDVPKDVRDRLSELNRLDYEEMIRGPRAAGGNTRSRIEELNERLAERQTARTERDAAEPQFDERGVEIGADGYPVDFPEDWKD